jgi:hypothetical protein
MKLASWIENHPAFRRIRKNFALLGERATETYEYRPAGGGSSTWLDICALKQSIPLGRMPVPLILAREQWAKIVNQKEIDLRHIENNTIINAFEPVLVCQGIGPNFESEVVDGNHRAVAWALRCLETESEIAPIPAILFKKSEWRKCVIPNNLAVALKFE